MDSRIKSDDSIWGAAARRQETLQERRLARMEDASTVDLQETGLKSQEATVSVRVTLSDDALERAAKARQGIAELSQAAAQSDKDAARAKLAEIKQRIKMLKMMLSMMGPSAAKGVIAELRQLAGQLSQVAATLQSGSGGGGGLSVAPMTAPVVHGAGASQAGDAAIPTATAGSLPMATAETAAAEKADDKASDKAGGKADDKADDDPAGAASHATSTSTSQDRQREARQRQADARAVNELIRELKALREAAERMLRQRDAADVKQFDDIDAALSEAEQSAQALNSSGGALPLDSGVVLDTALQATAPSA